MTTEAIIIMDRIMELDHEIHSLVTEMKRLTDMYDLGYRYVTEDGTPHMGHDNVVNIAQRLI